MFNTQQKYQNFDLLQKIQSGNLLIVDPQQKNGVILYKQYYADFAGPGAIIGGSIDYQTVKVLTLGNFSLKYPLDSHAKTAGYLIRRQWTRIINEITENNSPPERAQEILNQFEHWFDTETLNQIPDEALALLVGVLPQTIKSVRLLAG